MWVCLTTSARAQAVLIAQNFSVKALNYSQDKKLVGFVHLNPNEIRVLKTDSSWSINIGSESGGIKCFDFHPQESKIVIGFYNGNLELWDLTEPELLWSIQKHKAQVNDVKFSPQGNYILSCSADKTIQFSAIQNGHTLKKHFHDTQLNAAEFHPLDSTLFVTGDHGGNLIYWNVDTIRKLRVIKAHQSYIFDLVFFSNGKRLLSAGHDHLIKSWDYESGNMLKEFKGHTATVYSLDIDENQNNFISGSFDKKIYLWNYNLKKTINILIGHKDYINVVRYTPNGDIVSGSRDGTLRIWKK